VERGQALGMDQKVGGNCGSGSKSGTGGSFKAS